MSVHAIGEIRFMSDSELIEFMKKLTLKFEKGNTASLTFYDNLPDTFLSKMMPAMVGFEIKAEKLDNVFKLSQNRDEQSYENIIAKLEGRGGSSALITTEMKKRKQGYFLPVRSGMLRNLILEVFCKRFARENINRFILLLFSSLLFPDQFVLPRNNKFRKAR